MLLIPNPTTGQTPGPVLDPHRALMFPPRLLRLEKGVLSTSVGYCAASRVSIRDSGCAVKRRVERDRDATLTIAIGLKKTLVPFADIRRCQYLGLLGFDQLFRPL